jgi:hypothetical protein
LARHPPAERLLVFVDQLEELFTLVDADERRRFIAVLHALRAVSPCHLVLALRADFYGALMDSEAQRAALVDLAITGRATAPTLLPRRDPIAHVAQLRRRRSSTRAPPAPARGPGV